MSVNILGCTLEEYSDYVKLPIEALQQFGKSNGDWFGTPAVLSDYRDIDNKHVSNGYRIALKPSEFRREPGKPTSPYMAQKLSEAKIKDYLILVEGESDTEILSYVEMPVLGIPGADNWKSEYDEYLEDIKNIFVIVEPDKGGETFKESLQRSDHADRITLVSLPTKDIRDLWCSNPDKEEFKESLRTAFRNGRKVSKSPEDTYIPTEGNPMRTRSEDISVPQFPLHVFSEPIQEFIRSGAELTDTPPDFLAVSLLGYASGVIGKTARLQLKDGWHEYPCLWTVIVGEPSSGKSPAMGLIRKSVEKLQLDAKLEYQQRQSEYDEQLKRYKRDHHANPEPTEIPTLEHFMTTDATMESLAPMLSFSPGLVFSADEVLTWIGGMDKYNKGKSDKQHWMTLYNSDLLKIDRKSQVDSVIVDAPVVSIVGGTQPAVIPSVSQLWDTHDGFAERILWSYPTNDITGRWNENSTIDRSHIDQMFSKLRKEPLRTFILSSDAKAEWKDFYDNTHYRVSQYPKGHYLKGVLGKSLGQVARFSLNLHLVNEETESEISVGTLRGAIQLMDYCVDHSQKVRAEASLMKESSSYSLTKRITDFLGDEWTAKQSILHACRHHAKSEEVTRVLDELVSSKTIEVQERSTGGRPATEYRLSEGSISV